MVQCLNIHPYTGKSVAATIRVCNESTTTSSTTTNTAGNEREKNQITKIAFNNGWWTRNIYYSIYYVSARLIASITGCWWIPAIRILCRIGNMLVVDFAFVLLHFIAKKMFLTKIYSVSLFSTADLTLILLSFWLCTAHCSWCQNEPFRIGDTHVDVDVCKC